MKRLLKEEITEEFIEAMVDKIIARLSARLEDLDVSMDYIAAALTGQLGADIGVRQKGLGRFAKAGRMRGSEDG
jgi:hypothetical protein